MDGTIINAIERTEKLNKVRKEGFIPGVIYGKGTDSKGIKIKEKDFTDLQHGHGRNARVSVKIGDEVKQCFIKEIQRHPVKRNILNFELQTIHENDIIHVRVPIIFNGREKLIGRQELLQEYISEVEISCKVSFMPEFLSVNVEELKAGDKITIKDIPVENETKIIGNESEVVAVVTHAKESSEETVEEVAE